jgi:hypothetical protein
MIGYDSIGSQSVGEISQDGLDTIIYTPVAIAVNISTTAPIIIGVTIIVSTVPNITVTRAAPLVTAGKSILPASVSVGVTIASPGISISYTAYPVTQPVSVTALPPQILGGQYIEASNTVTMVTPYGEIGSGSVGQGSIGEGDESTRVVKRGPLVVISSEPPLIATGKSQFAPTSTVFVTSARAEIDARRRKLRIFAIAS